MSTLWRVVAILALVVIALWFGATRVAAEGQPKVTICHAAGLDGTLKYVTLTLAYPAVYGPAGHFYENGTPRAGHEEDYLGACLTDASPSPSGSLTPSTSAVPTSTPSPTPDPESTSPTPSATTGPPIPNTAMTGDWTTSDLLLILGLVLMALAAGGWAIERR